MRHSDRKSRLFFIEFLIVLFFFLIVGTVCLCLFAYARQITDRADALAHAQAEAASVAELISAADCTGMDEMETAGVLVETLQKRYPQSAITYGAEPIFLAFLDRDFQNCEPGESSYTMNIRLYSDTLQPEEEWSGEDDTEAEEDGNRMTDRVQNKMLDPATEKNADIHIMDQNEETLYTLSVEFHTPVTRGEALS